VYQAVTQQPSLTLACSFLISTSLSLRMCRVGINVPIFFSSASSAVAATAAADAAATSQYGQGHHGRLVVKNSWATDVRIGSACTITMHPNPCKTATPRTAQALIILAMHQHLKNYQY
jgi:hypothetical protein